MTANQFRTIALGLPETTEQSHMQHPDFRVGGKIFATLGYPSTAFGMVKLTPDQQRRYVEAHPDTFDVVTGAWGRRGATQVRLPDADEDAVHSAVTAAWCNTAPKPLVREFEAKRAGVLGSPVVSTPRKKTAAKKRAARTKKS